MIITIPIKNQKKYELSIDFLCTFAALQKRAYYTSLFIFYYNIKKRVQSREGKSKISV